MTRSFWLLACILYACQSFADDGTPATLELTQNTQAFAVKLGDLPASAVRVSVVPGESFPKPIAEWHGDGSVFNNGGTTPFYFKIWKGSLDDIETSKTAVVVYLRPVRVATSDGGGQWELQDIKVATDFSLVRHGNKAALEILTWCQFPSGQQKKITSVSACGYEATLKQQLHVATRARDSLPQLRSKLSEALFQSPNSVDFGKTDPRSEARALATAEAQANEIPDIEAALGVLPPIQDFTKQYCRKANFVISFSAKQDGETVILHPEKVPDSPRRK